MNALEVRLDPDVAAWICMLSKVDLRSPSDVVNLLLRRIAENPVAMGDLVKVAKALDKHNLRMRLEEKLP